MMTTLSGFASVSTLGSQVMDAKTIRTFLRLYNKVLTDKQKPGTLSYDMNSIVVHADTEMGDAHPGAELSIDAMSLLRQIAKVVGHIGIVDVDALFGNTPDEAYLIQCCLALNQQKDLPMLAMGRELFTIRYRKFGSLSTFPLSQDGVVSIRPTNSVVIFGTLSTYSDSIIRTAYGDLNVSAELCTWTNGTTLMASVSTTGDDPMIVFSYNTTELWITVVGDTIMDMIIPYSGSIDYINIVPKLFSRVIVSDMSDNITFAASIHSDPILYMEDLI